MQDTHGWDKHRGTTIAVFYSVLLLSYCAMTLLDLPDLLGYPNTIANQPNLFVLIIVAMVILVSFNKFHLHKLKEAPGQKKHLAKI